MSAEWLLKLGDTTRTEAKMSRTQVKNYKNGKVKGSKTVDISSKAHRKVIHQMPKLKMSKIIAKFSKTTAKMSETVAKIRKQ